MAPALAIEGIPKLTSSPSLSPLLTSEALGFTTTLCHRILAKSPRLGADQLSSAEVVDSAALIEPVLKNGLDELWLTAEPTVFHAAQQ